MTAATTPSTASDAGRFGKRGESSNGRFSNGIDKVGIGSVAGGEYLGPHVTNSGGNIRRSDRGGVCVC